MRAVRKYELFPMLCSAYKTEVELEEAINRSHAYISTRLNGKGEFTQREKKLTLEHLRIPIEEMKDYFPDDCTIT